MENNQNSENISVKSYICRNCGNSMRYNAIYCKKCSENEQNVKKTTNILKKIQKIENFEKTDKTDLILNYDFLIAFENLKKKHKNILDAAKTYVIRIDELMEKSLISISDILPIVEAWEDFFKLSKDVKSDFRDHEKLYYKIITIRDHLKNLFGTFNVIGEVSGTEGGGVSYGDVKRIFYMDEKVLFDIFETIIDITSKPEFFDESNEEFNQLIRNFVECFIWLKNNYHPNSLQAQLPEIHEEIMVMANLIRKKFIDQYDFVRTNYYMDYIKYVQEKLNKKELLPEKDHNEKYKIKRSSGKKILKHITTYIEMCFDESPDIDMISFKFHGGKHPDYVDLGFY